MKPIIYKIEFPDGSSYIGATTRFSERRRRHLQSKKRGAVNARVAAKFREFAVCGIYEVACALSMDSLHELEAQVIAQEQPNLNVNLEPHPISVGNKRRVRKPSTPPKKFGPYPSIGQAARALGVSHPYLTRLGSFEAYIQTRQPREMSHQLRIAVGDLNLTIKQWATKNSIPESTIHARRRYGWTDAEAVGEVERQRELVGPKPPTQKQIAKMEATRRKAERERAKAEKLAACEANNRPRVGGCPAEDLAALRERVAQDLAKNFGRPLPNTLLNT